MRELGQKNETTKRSIIDPSRVLGDFPTLVDSSNLEKNLINLVDYYFLNIEKSSFQERNDVVECYKLMIDVNEFNQVTQQEIKSGEEPTMSPIEIFNHINSSVYDIRFVRKVLRSLIDTFFINRYDEQYIEKYINELYCSWKDCDDLLGMIEQWNDIKVDTV